MDYIDYLNFLLKYIFINLTTCFLYAKISNFKSLTIKNKLMIYSTCIILSIIISTCSTFINLSYLLLISYIILSLLCSYITKYKLNHSIVIIFVSYAITLTLYELTIFISLLICLPLLHLDSRNPSILIFAISLEVLLIHLIFKIKRFKNGLSFFKYKEHSYKLAIFLSGITMLIVVNLGNYKSNSINELSLLGLILILLSMFIWIKEKITLHYKSLLVKDTIENLQNELNEQIHINQIMKDEIEKLSTINHKFSSRISALELYVENLPYNASSNISSTNNILEAKKLIHSLSAEFSDEMNINIQNNFFINKTGLLSIDNILDYFKTECLNKNISFNVIVKRNIKYEMQKSISLNLLEILISDIINNAIIAINHSTNKNNKILVQFDSSDYLEFRVYDTGIEFEIDTLVKLGKEQITTHKYDGGSGIGFITTFETLSKTNGSFIIEEYKKNDKCEYSKCLIFKFDNKKQFIIRSYRANEIKKISNDELIIQSLS